MRKLSILFISLLGFSSQAQELFVMAEPASNAPAGSISARVGQSLLKNEMTDGNIYSIAPEVTWGINKNFMVRGSAYLDDMNNGLGFSGASAYAKYRFLSVDDMQSHFRMAAFGRYSHSKGLIHQEAIDLAGMNSGFEAGIVATQLIKKVAISAIAGFVQAFDNSSYDFPSDFGKSAVNYSLSVGRLMHPKKYTSYKETNINTMLELVGQTNTENGKSYLDIVPSVQFIINSQARVDIAYKKELYSSLHRINTDGVYLKLEYTFFNVTK